MRSKCATSGPRSPQSAALIKITKQREDYVMSGKSLEGRKALVTGGARGIGAAIAQALARSGAAVMIGDILDDTGKASAARASARALAGAAAAATRVTWK